MKSALASTWECAYLLPTIACLSDQFPKTRQEKVYWKTSAKLQVSFKRAKWLYRRAVETSHHLFAVIEMTIFCELRDVMICFHRGSPRSDLVPPAGWQEEEPWLLFPWVWRPQVCSAGAPPPNEWQGQGVGEPSHCRVGWPCRWAGPGGHGQGLWVQCLSYTPHTVCSFIQGSNIFWLHRSRCSL